MYIYISHIYIYIYTYIHTHPCRYSNIHMYKMFTPLIEIASTYIYIYIYAYTRLYEHIIIYNKIVTLPSNKQTHTSHHKQTHKSHADRNSLQVVLCVCVCVFVSSQSCVGLSSSERQSFVTYSVFGDGPLCCMVSFLC